PPPTSTLFPYTTLFRSIKVGIDVQLLRGLVEDLHGAGVDVLAQVEAEGLGIAQDLCRMFIQGDQQAALALCLRPFQQQLHAEDGLAGARDAHDHRGGAVEDATTDQRIEWPDADDRAPGGRGRLREVAAGSRL